MYKPHMQALLFVPCPPLAASAVIKTFMAINNQSINLHKHLVLYEGINK